jgi:hypothetical protein
MSLLAQFLLRLTFGLALGMAITSPKQVTSGYFRNHLYVTLGLATLAALILAKTSTAAMSLAIAAAVLSFIGAACWLYEASRAGRITLALVAACGLASALIANSATTSDTTSNSLWSALNVISSGLVLGLVIAAMLLGHWYLNAPGMSLTPLRRLLAAAAIAVCFQALLSSYDIATAIAAMGHREAVCIADAPSSISISNYWLIFLALRWSFGIIGVLALLWMAWRTLDIPNTQSATGILYVAVIGVFVGELAAALLSATSAIAV